MSNKPFELRASGFIEFEQVEVRPVPSPVESARDETLDHDPLSINFERKKDRKTTSTDRMLAGATIDWLVAFPNESRPKALCEKFPHVANRLAQDWAQAQRSTRSLEALVGDSRWGQAGFPVQVQIELQRLLNLRATAQPARAR